MTAFQSRPWVAHAVLLRSQETPLHRRQRPTHLFFFQRPSIHLHFINSSSAMSDHWNRLSEHHKRICLFPMPRIPRLGPKARDTAIYVSGALFALGWWFFIDAVIRSKNWNYDNGYKQVSVTFVDWVPGICSTLGMIVINCIDKAALRGDSFSFNSGGGTSVAWKARVFLFVGFAFMAGGLAGSVSVLCIKYLLPGYGEIFNFWGICNVIQNASIMSSAAILWVAQNTESEYQYNFAI